MDPMIIDPVTGLPGYSFSEAFDETINTLMAEAEGDPETEPGEPLVTPPPRDPDEEDDEPEEAPETPDDDKVEGAKDDDVNDTDNEPDAEGRKTHE